MSKLESKLEGAPVLASYDHIIVAFSGGKDSLAAFLHLIDLGVDLSKVELWHHDIDGHGDKFMDWAITPDYCRKVGQAFNVPCYMSWREGGFLREMLRDETPTAKVCFETPSGVEFNKGGKGSAGTRMKFPQMSADLTTRWCSAYLKIDVAAAAIANQKRFKGKKVLVVTGERAEESGARARYNTFEIHRSNAEKREKRTVHQWRPVHAWTTEQVWEEIRKHKVNSHPVYRMGWGRCSCACCIFGNADQWASAKLVAPEQFEKVAGYEEQFGVTIRRKESIRSFVETGKAYATITEELRALANSTEFNEPIILDVWVEPAGAKAELAGPC